MGSSARLFGRQRSVHQILGGGTNVVLWRRDVTVLLGLLAAWLVLERSGYILLSFVSNLMLLLISILFTWARAAAILNRWQMLVGLTIKVLIVTNPPRVIIRFSSIIIIFSIVIVVDNFIQITLPCHIQ
ncbi:reticulon-like protein B12 isoform X2 [Elaeis guineensis]|uniref:reticulon-like protein B12 isoform X2 n=1 Tax=Elaeis guineensis var. tenera TaxID=51953 RepID=UPI003C6D5B35